MRWLAAWALLGLAPMATAAPSLQDLVDAAPPSGQLSVPPGDYRGNLVISKPLRIDGANMARIFGNGTDKTVLITSPDVVFEGFEIVGSGRNLMGDDAGIHVSADRVSILRNSFRQCLHSIYLKKTKDCRVVGNTIVGTAAVGSIPDGGSDPEKCDAAAPGGEVPGNGIHLWNCERAEIAGNDICNTRDGIYFSFTNGCRISGNMVRHARYGLHYMYSDNNFFEENRFERNAAGAAVMFSERLEIRRNEFVDNLGGRACGLILQSVDDARIEENHIERNAVGLSMNQCNRNRVVRNSIDRNHVGLRFGGNSDENAFSLNSLRRNAHPVEMLGEVGSNLWSVAGVGNYWDNAPPVDFDGDGLGDLPHRELDVFAWLRRDFPEVNLLSGSPAIGLLRFANQRAALPGLNVVEDRAPILRASRRNPF